MAVTIQEKLLKAKRPDVMLGKIAARMAELERKLIHMRELQAEYNELKAAVVAYADQEYPADEDVSIATSDVEIEISQKDYVRVITDMPALFTYLGKKRFLEAAKFPIKALDTYVPKPDQKAFVKRAREGARTCKVVILKGKGKQK